MTRFACLMPIVAFLYPEAKYYIFLWQHHICFTARANT